MGKSLIQNFTSFFSTNSNDGLVIVITIIMNRVSGRSKNVITKLSIYGSWSVHEVKGGTF